MHSALTCTLAALAFFLVLDSEEPRSPSSVAMASAATPPPQRIIPKREASSREFERKRPGRRVLDAPEKFDAPIYREARRPESTRRAEADRGQSIRSALQGMPCHAVALFGEQTWVATGGTIRIKVEPRDFDAAQLRPSVGDEPLVIIDSYNAVKGNYGYAVCRAPNVAARGPLRVEYRERRLATERPRADVLMSDFRVLSDTWTDLDGGGEIVRILPFDDPGPAQTPSVYEPDMTVYEGARVTFRLNLAELPGDRFLRWLDVMPQGTTRFAPGDLHLKPKNVYPGQQPGYMIVSGKPVSWPVAGCNAEITGRFEGSGEVTLRLGAEVSDSETGQKRQVAFDVATFDIVPREKYVIQNTWSWREKLQFTLHGEHGACTGTSQGLAGSHALGLIKVDSDLAFHLRSQPSGAQALWKSDIVELNPNWEITALKWKEAPVVSNSLHSIVSRSGESRVPLLAPVKYSKSMDGPYPFHWQGWTNYVTKMPDGAWSVMTPYLEPVTVMLTCGSAPSNGQGVTAQLEWIELVGPPDASVSDAFK